MAIVIINEVYLTKMQKIPQNNCLLQLNVNSCHLLFYILNSIYFELLDKKKQF